MEKNFGTLNFDATGGTKQINVSFKDGECSDTRIGVNSDSPTWLTAECTNKVITLTAKPNTSAQRDGYVYVSVNGIPCEGNIYWTQDSGAEPCTCVNVLSMDASKIIWEADESNPVTRQITIDRPDCNVNVISVTSNDTSKFSATLNNNKSAITVTPVGEASTTSTSALVTLSYSAEGLTSCTKSIQVERLGTNCDCNSLSLNQKSISWESDNKDEVDRDISFPECITIKSSSSSLLPSSSHFGARLELSDNTHGVIRIIPKDVNTAATPIRDELTLVYNVNGQTEDCTKSIQLTHQGTRCGCGNFELTPSSLVWENNEDGQKSILFIDSTTATCVTINQDETQLYYEDGSEVDPIDYHFTSITIDNSAKTIKVKPISNQGQTETIKRVLKFVYYANGERCGNGETLLTHKGIGCDCDSELWITVGVESFLPDASGEEQSATAEFKYNENCIDKTKISVEITGTSKDYFAYKNLTVDGGNGSVEVYPTSTNLESDDDRIATLLIKYSEDDCEFNKEIPLKQSGKYCSCDETVGRLITSRHIFPLTGITNYEFATGSTKGCGHYVTGTTMTGYTITITESSNNNVSFKVTASPKTAEPNPEDMRIQFKGLNGKAPEGCSFNTKFIQKGCSCFSDFTKMIHDEQGDDGLPAAKSDSGGVTIYRINKDCTSYQLPNPPASWIYGWNVDRNSSDTYIFLKAMVVENTSSESRSADFVLTPYVTYGTEIRDDCDPITLTVRQQGNGCECDSSTPEVIEITSSSKLTLGKKYYPSSCFSSNKVEEFFTVDIVKNDTECPYTDDDNWIEVKGDTYHKRSEMDAYCLRLSLSASTNEGSDRCVKIKVTANLKSGSCEKIYTIEQPGASQDNCEQATNKINKSLGNISYSGGTTKALVHCSANGDYTLELAPNQTLPCWLSDSGHTDSSGTNYPKRLYFNIKPNSGSTGGENCSGVDSAIYKTKERSIKLKFRLKKSDGTYCSETEELTLTQDGWSGSCNATTTQVIAFRQTDGFNNEYGCNASYKFPDKPDLYHAYKSSSEKQDICDFTISGYTPTDDKCLIVRAEVQGGDEYVSDLEIVEQSSSTYKFKLKGIIHAYTGSASCGTPIEVTLKMYRRVGNVDDANGYEPIDGKNKSFSIAILRDDTDCGKNCGE